MAEKVRFFNTMARQLQEFESITPDKVGLYTCGPTVYNFAHIGNFRAYTFEDILCRTLRLAGYEVKQVMNLTDVDDKTIRDSQAEKLPLKEFTARYIKAFFEDLAKLRIHPAAVYPAATEHIPEMIALIQKLFDKGYAYIAEDKSIYFAIDKFAPYGKLANIDRENQRAGVRIKTDEYAKDSVADFALWKAWDDKDGDVVWDSPWGKGRPGWHIECSAMAMKYLGPTFDIHTGGIDNMFPHHEDEIAQSEGANDVKYVNYWLHCAHLMVNGEKMSKSLGNFFTLRDLENQGRTGREIRYVLMGTHYRKKLNFTFDALDQARETLKKFDDCFVRLAAANGDGSADSEAAAAAEKAVANFKAAMFDDLNTAEASAAIYSLFHDANKLLAAGTVSAAGAAKMLDAFRTFDKVWACLDVDAALAADNSIPAEIEALAAARVEARKNKNWAESDRLRDEIKSLGYAIEDAPGGTYRLKKL